MMIAITGSSRGGTTAVAGVVRRLGYTFPDAAEHLDALRLLRSYHRDTHDDFIRTVDEIALDTWAFKLPGLDSRIERTVDLLEHIPEHKVIVVWRDPFSVLLHRDGDPTPEGLAALQAEYARRFSLVETLMHRGTDLLNVSYEKLITYPRLQVYRIRDWLGSDADVETAIASIKPGAYIE